MSYCRWSSDDFRSDVYVYSDVEGGYTTHVATYRRVGPVTPMPDLDELHSDDPTPWMDRYHAHIESVQATDLVAIGLECDGQSFNDPDLHSLMNRLMSLRTMGYYVPQSAIERITTEIAEGE